jgi:hypothetical protein
VNQFQPIFDKQKDYFNTDATKSYEWRIEQLDRVARMLNENNEAFQEAVSKDFKTAFVPKQRYSYTQRGDPHRRASGSKFHVARYARSNPDFE